MALPGEQRTGKKTSQLFSQVAASGLVFFSKSPPTGLVRNQLQSVDHVLTIQLTDDLLMVCLVFFQKKTRDMSPP